MLSLLNQTNQSNHKAPGRYTRSRVINMVMCKDCAYSEKAGIHLLRCTLKPMFIGFGDSEIDCRIDSFKPKQQVLV